MGKIYRIEHDGKWVEAGNGLRACGPFIFDVSETGGSFPDREECTQELGVDERGSVPVPHGLGMGWPG